MLHINAKNTKHALKVTFTKKHENMATFKAFANATSIKELTEFLLINFQVSRSAIKDIRNIN